MDWEQIKEKYPKAWNNLIQFKLDGCLLFCSIYNQYELGIDEDECGYQEIRDLYDFFDSNNIHIEILIDKTMEPKYCYSIHTYNDAEIEWIDKLNVKYSDLEYTREKAEESGFNKAFEILEIDLNK